MAAMPTPDAVTEEITVPASFEGMTQEELQAEYKHRFGRAAPPLMKYGTLIKKLTEKHSAGPA